MRNAFSDTLVSLAKADPNVLLLTGDHGYALFDAFRAQCPDQYINAGIAEQNMVGMAAGLARAGYRPFVYGLAAFVPVRVVEQIKLDIAHDDLPVVLCGDGAGFVYSHLGTSHQSTEDIACTRAIPGLKVYSPADRFELEKCMTQAYEKPGPVYLRMGKADLGDVHSGPISSSIERMFKVSDADEPSDNLAIIATGSMSRTAITLKEKFFTGSEVWTVPSIKPLDTEGLISIARRFKNICVLEEHSIYGGLGSAIAEACSEMLPVRVIRVGVKDRFSHHCGTYKFLLDEHGLSLEGVFETVKNLIK
ncbi:transketolase [Xylophilus sp. Kf1]|nr:transketolase [Xylophilus sp. Kf1]